MSIRFNIKGLTANNVTIHSNITDEVVATWRTGLEALATIY